MSRAPSGGPVRGGRDRNGPYARDDYGSRNGGYRDYPPAYPDRYPDYERAALPPPRYAYDDRRPLPYDDRRPLPYDDRDRFLPPSNGYGTPNLPLLSSCLV